MAIFSKLTQSIIYFSKVYRVPVESENGERLGRVVDLFVDFEDIYPAVLAVQFYDRGYYFYCDWSEITSFSYERVVIRDSKSIKIGKTYSREVNESKEPRHLFSDRLDAMEIVDYPGVAKLVLDKQIVDMHGKKVVRVNDIHLVKVGSALRVTHADIGVKGVIRRLGFDAVIDHLSKRLLPKNSKYLKNEGAISWKYVHAIPDKSIKKHVELNVANEDIENIHPADLADILEDLNLQGRKQLFGQLDPEIQAQTLSEIDMDKQVSLLEDVAPEVTAKIIENMDPDEAADVLSEFDDAEVDEIISQIHDNEVQEEIQELLDYDEDTAGGIMSTEVFSVGASDTKETILEKIISEHENIESIYDIFVVDDKNILLGYCSLAALLTRRENVVVSDIMENKDIKYLAPTDHWKKIALHMSKYNLINVPIVDEQRELLGIVSVDDILPWALNEK
ncbi:MAG: magnesium transporter [Oligoflexia bacterium]|nr:magnesium transporter [Oligoflexia bacterium]